LRSTNGTYIADQRLPPHKAVPWREGPTVRIGPFNITLDKPSGSANYQA
jgi:pSer/pThr/pTyr-binding forkhead associated (FHA) protein